ncbi:nucleotide disphospho-sugar-binding domain-containing protein [Polymorphospora rubra]|uniref:nucleotide disphospho-sugar-binding domain-containing protein n=1 Tax=Polymorphospora rubra TaxID=338584 RepID=UPI0033D1CEA6
MRVLISTWGWRSHFFPLVPLGWALRAAGHEVLVASQPAMVAAITTAGLPAVAVGADLDFAEVFGGRIGRVADEDAKEPAPDTVAPMITADGGVVRYADAMLDALVAAGRSWRPDLVVYEPYNLAGPIAAAALDVPGVRHLWGPDSSTGIGIDEDEIIAPRAARIGAGRVDLAGALTLDPCPAPMQVPLAGPAAPIRFVPYNGPAVLPDWLLAPPDRPRICLTWGTMMAGVDLPGTLALRTVAGALCGLGAEVVVAVDAAQHADLAGLPAEVRVADAPLALHLLLPSCRVLVQQGGAGTTMTGLAGGVPQLVLPQVSDQHFNAVRLAETGAGTVLTDDAVTAGRIRERVADLLAADHWRDAARVAADRVAAAPSPADVVTALQALVHTREVLVV